MLTNFIPRLPKSKVTVPRISKTTTALSTIHSFDSGDRSYVWTRFNFADATKFHLNTLMYFLNGIWDKKCAFVKRIPIFNIWLCDIKLSENRLYGLVYVILVLVIQFVCCFLDTLCDCLKHGKIPTLKFRWRCRMSLTVCQRLWTTKRQNVIPRKFKIGNIRWTCWHLALGMFRLQPLNRVQTASDCFYHGTGGKRRNILVSLCIKEMVSMVIFVESKNHKDEAFVSPVRQNKSALYGIHSNLRLRVLNNWFILISWKFFSATISSTINY